MAEPVREQRTIRVGKYELCGRLAVGGMAELFVARTRSLHGFEKLVALKRVLPQHVANQRLVRLLMHEAKLAANLNHPNIAQVYDVGEYAGTYFFTMEYVLGKDLRDIVRAAVERGRWLPIEHAVGIVIGVAAALHYAHTARGPGGQPLGIIHRDISPSNVLVTYDGVVKLVDFGIALAASLDMNSGGHLPAGKIPYMSPEQCRDETIDARSDIFSLGIVLWELTVGRRLFVSKGNPVALLSKIANEPAPPPSAISPDYPEELERIVMKALEIDRTKRYSTAQELQVDLEEFARHERLAISPTRMAAYMQELFADELKNPPELNLEGVEEEKEVSLPSTHFGGPPTLIPREISATATATPPAPPPVAVPLPAEPEPAPSRRVGVFVGAGLVGVALVAWVLSGSRSSAEPARPSEAVPVAQPARTEPARTEPAKTEPAKTEPAKTEPVEPEKTAPVEPEKTESPKVDADKAAKKGDKRKKKPEWDPNSPLPPI